MNGITPIPYREHLLIPADKRLLTLIPHAQTLMHEGREVMIVPHRVDETQVLRNLGYDVRPPVMLNYDWCGSRPFDTQRVTTALITMHKRCYVLNGIGTGKTRSLLFAFDYLKRMGEVTKMLVVAPLSTLRLTWLREITLIFPHLTAQVLHSSGGKASRLKALAKDADIYIINHDGVEVIQKELLARTDIDMLGLDECSAYKNRTTDLWKSMHVLSRGYKRVVGLTATPVTTAPTDAFGQLKMITPGNCPLSYTGFRDETMLKLTAFKWVARKNAMETIHRRMQPAVRFTRDECYDLPPCQTVTRTVALSQQQKSYYTEMANECAIEIASGNVKAVNEADRINKLVQIALGVVYDVNRNPIRLDCASRLAVLNEMIAESNSKTIVFTPYKSSLAMLQDFLSKHWSVEVISGDVAAGKREQIFTRFMHAPDPHVLLAHPATMSHGLTLTEASTVVWYGPPGSAEEYQQANGRISRAGQRHAQLIVHLAATRMEQRIYTRLEKNMSMSGLLLDMFEAQELKELL
jgi:SNF2 family DNA or RNA helicase